MAFTATLLAGGESRRMGRDKATLLWRDRPLWEWQLEKLSALQPERMIISVREEPSWRPSGVEIVLDQAPSHGPLSGIAAALGSTKTDCLVVLAVDMPYMTIGHLRELFGARVSAGGVVPMIDGRAEPLCAIYPAESCREFESALSGPDFSLQPVVHRLVAAGRLREWPVPANLRTLYRSINEPGDLG